MTPPSAVSFEGDDCLVGIDDIADLATLADTVNFEFFAKDQQNGQIEAAVGAEIHHNGHSTPDQLTSLGLFDFPGSIDISLLASLPISLDNLVAQVDAPGKATPRKRAKKGTVPRSQQNRASAQRVRDRQKAREQYLEQSVATLDRENAELESKLETMRINQSQLLLELATLRETVARSAATLINCSTTPYAAQETKVDFTAPDTPVSVVEDFGSRTEHASPSSEIDVDTPEPSEVYSPGAASDATGSPSSEFDMPGNSSPYPLTPADTVSSVQLSPSSPGMDLSCESAALADRPQQQDILRLVILLQLMMGTTLSWASTIALLTTLSSNSSTSSHLSAPSIPSSPRSCRNAARITEQKVRASLPPDIEDAPLPQAWHQRLAMC